MKHPSWSQRRHLKNHRKQPELLELGRPIRVTGLALASNKTLFASRRFSIHARGIDDWSIPTFAQISGLVCTAAYCKDPQSCLRHCRSCSVTGAWGSLRRWRRIWIGSIFSIYCLWQSSILPSSNWRYRIPQKSNSPILKAPKEYFPLNFSIIPIK